MTIFKLDEKKKRIIILYKKAEKNLFSEDDNRKILKLKHLNRKERENFRKIIKKIEIIDNNLYFLKKGFKLRMFTEEETTDKLRELKKIHNTSGHPGLQY